MNLNSTWIEDLLKNNHPPSEEQGQEIQKLLLEPSKELEGLDSQISALKNRLTELERRQTEIRKQKTGYEAVLSPIRRIPSDVLREIFFHCLPTHRNPIMSSSDCPLLLTRICSSWREAAMTTPKLWDRLYITFTDQDTVPDLESLTSMPQNSVSMDGWRCAQSKAVKERTSALLRKRCEAVREWFLRSGTRPLSISLHFETTSWYLVPYFQRQPSITMEFFSLLASLAHRWKRFEINSTMNIFKILDNMLPISRMSLLTSLAGVLAPKYWDYGNVRPSLRILEAPNLRRILISVPDTRFWGLTAQSVVQWNKLTHITCMRISLPETLVLFRNASNLVHYKGTITRHRGEDALNEGHISLPFLRSLSINETVDPSVVSNVYDCIDAPSLQWVTYGNHSPIANSNYYSPDHPAQIPILPLLRRSTELRYLCLDGADMNIWDIGTTLRAVPSVTQLVIGSEAKYFNPTSDYRDQNPFLRQSWSFRELVVGAFFNDTENDPQVLLPRLFSLAISCSSLSISDDTLFDLIKSRMTSPETAILRSVKGRFYREIQKDITTEIANHGELVGVKVQLDLKYVQFTGNLFSGSISPRLGLKEETAFVPSWKDKYEDPEDITSRWHFGSEGPFL